MFRGEYNVAETLVEVLGDYCLYHGLSAHCCQLFHDGKSLAKSKLLGQVCMFWGLELSASWYCQGAIVSGVYADSQPFSRNNMHRC